MFWVDVRKVTFPKKNIENMCANTKERKPSETTENKRCCVLADFTLQKTCGQSGLSKVTPSKK